MRLAVVGAGAMGGTLAAEAALAGHDVVVLDVSQDIVDRVRDSGLTVDQPEGPIVAQLRAETSAENVGQVDCVVLFVKAQHTESAGRSIEPMIGPETSVVTLQNGWGNADVLAGLVEPRRLVMGVTYHSCTLLAPAHLAHTGRGATFVGPFDPAGSLDAASSVADLLSKAGWPTDATPSIRTEIWKKLVLNAATLPTAALSRLCAGELGRPGALLDLIDGLAEEAVAVARSMSLDVDRAERLDRIHAVLIAAGKGKASMLQDVEAGRKTEIETVNGAVARVGAEQGVPVPLNRAMVALIGGLERSWAL